MHLPSQINCKEDLHAYLQVAMQLEHATLPPYLTALYSINPETNSDAYHILRVVAVEEMLHLAQAANILIAVGGTPKLTEPDFIPTYPTPLPDGEQDFLVDLQAFSPDAVKTFLKIERPGNAPNANSRRVSASPARTAAHAALAGTAICSCQDSDGEEVHFWSIGEFYAEIERGLTTLAADASVDLFSGKDKLQVNSASYYSGGGKLVQVVDLASARTAIERIIYQGEGYDQELYNHDNELAHYYRFQQLQIGRYYQLGDQKDQPTGPELHIDWFNVVPIKKNIAVADYHDAPELKASVKEFNQIYRGFLMTLEIAFNGQPELIDAAVPKMFELRNGITRIINNPLPGSYGLHAAPLFAQNLNWS